MIQVTQREIDLALSRYDHRLAEAARARFIEEAKKPSPSTEPQKVFTFSFSLRQAVVALTTLAPVG